jgi:hypothetical protein
VSEAAYREEGARGIQLRIPDDVRMSQATALRSSDEHMESPDMVRQNQRSGVNSSYRRSDRSLRAGTHSYDIGGHAAGMGIEGSGNGTEDVVVEDDRVYRREVFGASGNTSRMDTHTDQHVGWQSPRLVERHSTLHIPRGFRDAYGHEKSVRRHALRFDEVPKRYTRCGTIYGPPQVWDLKVTPCDVCQQHVQHISELLLSLLCLSLH